MKRPAKARVPWLRRRVAEAFDDPRPNVQAREVFKRLRQYHAKQVKAERNAKKA